MVERLRRMIRGWGGVYPYLPYKETQLRQMVADGRLAPPVQLGPRAIAFFEDTLIEAQERLVREQREREQREREQREREQREREQREREQRERASRGKREQRVSAK